jgi:hypothetical protein
MAKQVELTFTVKMTVKLAEGKESTKNYIAEEARVHLEDDANPGAFYGDKDGRYDVTAWVVSLAD